MSNLEDRLRAELARTGGAADVGAAPSVDALADVAAGRHRRNRTVGTIGGFATVAVIGVGAFVAVQPDAASDVVAAGDSTAEATAAQAPVNEVEPGDAADTTLEESPEVTQSEVDGELAVRDEDGNVIGFQIETESGDVVTTIPPELRNEGVGVASFGDDDLTAVIATNSTGDIELGTTPTTVEFAGGSGVFVVPSGGGYSGLAMSFTGSGATAIGLTSNDGLLWSEAELSGVPAGATATRLVEHAGGFVALFEQPSSSGPGNNVLVGTSADLANWTLSDPLPGSDVFALHLVAGPGGVVVIGDDFDRAVWSGPIGGPYVAQASLDSLGAVLGVTVVDGEFLIVGRSAAEGNVTLRSADGIDWEQSPLAVPAGSDPGILRVAGASLVAGAASDTDSSYVSDDGGVTWAPIDVGPISEVATGGDTTAFLSASQPTVTVSNGTTLSTVGVEFGAADRVSLLSVDDERVILLADTEDGLHWIVASY